jgi:hypothetical protein
VIELDPRDTLTEATGATATVIDEVPALPSLVAVIVADPGATAATNPLPSTVAAAELLDDHVTVLPVRSSPFESLRTVASCCVGVIPSTRLAVVGLTTTLATGAGVTISGALPNFPSLVATMFVVPVARAVTRPVGETIATAVLLELQLTARPVSGFPLPSSGVAVPCEVPTAVIEVGLSETVTELTATGVTVMVDVPLLPSLEAVIVA